MLSIPPPVAGYTTNAMNMQSPQLLGSPVQQARYQRMFHPTLNAGTSMGMPALSQNPMSPQMMSQALAKGSM